MVRPELEDTARTLVGAGKGILAADETAGTLNKRFAALRIETSAENRRSYRELLFTTPHISEFISGVIMVDETIRQADSGGRGICKILADQGIIPGIKVDAGAKPLAGSPEETVTEGLDGLRERLQEYRSMGARFAKWRAVIRISRTLPSPRCLHVNAHALGRYAALCQEAGLVPIVEPEVLMDGDHTIERCEEVTSLVHHYVFRELFDQGVSLEGLLLKPNMVLAGKECPQQPSVDAVARATTRNLRRMVPAAVPGIVFLSGGQGVQLASQHLNAVHQVEPSLPWAVTFSYARALQDPALHAWMGKKENAKAAQRAFHHRALCNSAASLGKYSEDLERSAA